MGLAIGVKERDIVYVGDIPVRVKETRGFEYAVVEVDGKDFVLTDLKSTEIIPDVFVHCGKPDQRFLEKHQRLQKSYEEGRRAGTQLPDPGRLLPRLIFDAPRAVVILREELYDATRHAA